jgi:hypothetical protein
MIKNYVRTCDLCHRQVAIGNFVRRDAEPDGLDLLMVLIANQNNTFEFDENPDGTVPLDTCFDCATRITLPASQLLN